jgi:hypothetical protein
VVTGYRPVPGYGERRLPDLPGGLFSIATRGRTSRRFFNPELPLGDPLREIGDSTYYRLVREAEQEEEGTRIRALGRRETARDRAEVVGPHWVSPNKSPEQAALEDEYLADITYQARASGALAEVESKRAGGVQATQLELMNLRPMGATWRVGTPYRERNEQTGRMELTAAGRAMEQFRTLRDISSVG